MLFSNANAAGFGNLTVLSSLGQPLHAEIELISTANEDAGPLVVKLAPIDAFRQANVEFNPALFSLRFAMVPRGGRQFVRVTSTQPINEPFIDILLELNSGSGRLVRDFIFLLDPVELRAIQTVQGTAVGNNVIPQANSSQAPQPLRSIQSAPTPQAMPAATTPGVNKPAQQALPPSAKRAMAPQSAAPAKADAYLDKSRTKTKPATPSSTGGSRPRLVLSDVTEIPGAATENDAPVDKRIAEVNARIKALEQQLNDLQKLVEVTANIQANLDKRADAAKADAKPAAPAAATASASNVAADIKPAEVKNAIPVAPAVAPAAPVKPKPAPAAPETSLIGDPLVWSVAGLLLAVLGALGIYTVRRKKEQKSFEDSIFADASLEANSAPRSHGGQSTDTGSSAANASVSPPVSQLDTNLGDPVAEADIYMVYGRDVQAEKILKEVLLAQPERLAVRVKLLTIYATRKDLRSFEPLARELHGMTKGESEEWMQAAKMGFAIDPNNPLYAAGKPPEEATAKADLATALAESVAGQGPDALPPTPQLEPVPEDIPDLEFVSSETGETTPAAEVPEPLPETLAEFLADLPPADNVEPAAADSTSNDLDSYLKGLGLGNADVPTIPSAANEPVIEFGPIDLDFLLPEKTGAAAEKGDEVKSKAS